MNNLYASELAVLAYLHEHAEAFDESDPHDPRKIMAETGLDLKEMKKAISYLREKRLIYQLKEYASFADVDFVDVYLTADGDDLMRELDSTPGVTSKITTGSLKLVGVVIYGIIQDKLKTLLTTGSFKG